MNCTQKDTSNFNPGINESINHMFFSLTKEWKFDYVNSRLAKFVNSTPGELLNHYISEKFLFFYGSELDKNCAEVMNTRKSIHYYGTINDQSYEIIICPSEEGIEVFLMDCPRQEELHKNEMMLEVITDMTDDIIYVKDLEGRLLFANPATLHFYGKSAEQVIGKSDMELCLDPDSAKFYMESDRRVIQSGKKELIEEPVFTSDGMKVYLTAKSPYYNSKGKLVGVFGISRDITERKKIEEALRQSEEQLKHRVEELGLANRELEAYSYSVSHDLRAPLNAIIGFSNFLIEDYCAKLDSTGQDFLMRIKSGAHRMNELIECILSLSKISRFELVSHHVNISHLAERFIDELRSSQPDRLVDIRIEKDMNIHGDSRLMELALTNLLRNAWKFTREKTCAVIEFASVSRNGKKVFFVRDNGVGFDMKYYSRLFIPFQRLHSDLEFRGNGIGLATVARVIERHRGKIWAESGPGKGATFFFTINSGMA